MKSNVWLRLVSKKMRIFFLLQISGSALIFNLDVKEFVFLSDVEVYIYNYIGVERLPAAVGRGRLWRHQCSQVV